MYLVDYLSKVISYKWVYRQPNPVPFLFLQFTAICKGVPLSQRLEGMGPVGRKNVNTLLLHASRSWPAILEVGLKILITVAKTTDA